VIIFSLIPCALFIFLTVEVSKNDFDIFSQMWVIYLEFSVSILDILDYILQFLLAESKYST